MKTILATSDFSEASKNAVKYAGALAHKTGAQLFLLHVYHPPVIVSEGYIVTPSIEEMSQDSDVRLKLLSDELQSLHGKELPIECISKIGLAADEIESLTKEKHIDLVIMGMQNTAALSEKLFGSTTTSFLSKTSCPTLCIQENVKFKPIKKIAYTSDHKLKGTTIPAILKTISKIWNAPVHILHVFSEERDVPDFKEAIAGLKLDHMMQGIEHSFHAVVNNNVVQGINNYAAEHNIDLIVMSPRKHSFFESLFRESNTKRMAFHANVPLLALVE